MTIVFSDVGRLLKTFVAFFDFANCMESLSPEVLDIFSVCAEMLLPKPVYWGHFQPSPQMLTMDMSSLAMDTFSI